MASIEDPSLGPSCFCFLTNRVLLIDAGKEFLFSDFIAQDIHRRLNDTANGQFIVLLNHLISLRMKQNKDRNLQLQQRLQKDSTGLLLHCNLTVLKELLIHIGVLIEEGGAMRIISSTLIKLQCT